MPTLFQDVRYAVRQLRKSPGFTTAAVITLALGIGACTAIFSAVNPILFEPLPYPHSGRIMAIWETRSGGSPLAVTFATFHGISERSRSLDSLAAMKPWQPAMTGSGLPERFDGQRVSSEYFRVLGVPPTLGRDFLPIDDQYRGPDVVILSDHLWRTHFNADSSILGRQIRLDDTLFTVIGVMPASFDNVLAPSAQLWAPLQYNPALLPDSREWGHHLRMAGRLRTGVDARQARNELSAIVKGLGQLYAKGYESSGGPAAAMIVNPLQDDITRSVRPALLAILAAVVLLLVIACVNVTNLLLARGAQRRGEFAVRAAVGAVRARLIRQVLAESVLLAAIGGFLGLGVAEVGIRGVVALSPVELPRLAAIHLDAAVFLFALAIATLAGLGVGLIPALHASRTDLQQNLQLSSRRASSSQHLARRTLVVTEVALALVLLVGAGLLLRSLRRLFTVDPGFDPSHVLTMQVQETGHSYDDDGARDRFFTAALENVRRVPGVVSAAFTSQLPLSGDFESYGMQFESHPNEEFGPAYRYAASPGYFKTMHIPLLHGRLLDEHDHELSAQWHRGACRPCGGSHQSFWRVGGEEVMVPAAVLISESLAKREFPGQDPIGQRVRVGPKLGHPEEPWDMIVGVVGDVKQASLAVNEPDAFYTTDTEWAWVDSVQSLVVRTEGDPAVLAPSIRKAIWSVDKDQPIVRVATMNKLLADSEAQRRFALVLFESFGLVALALVAIGLFGILSGSVTERTQEIGVRSALGASRMNILALVIRQGMTLVGLGVAIGLAGAAAASSVIASMLFRVRPLDPVTFIGTALLLAFVALLACYFPARRAANVDPMEALRHE